jgi:hypothetical protein
MVRELTTKRFLRGCLAMAEFCCANDAFLALALPDKTCRKARARASVKINYMVSNGL